MSTNSTVITPRFLVGIMLGASLALIGLAVWMIANDERSPVFVGKRVRQAALRWRR